eukprot:CAMPEP_0169297164 /NCGR_PEP_ID=MMETSP1016-20121227/65551_1 /TAXON_ID=342587 /ORGANISM="Karlodinium micrum, Strain CCMP2283" /LENGTH=108 /DNA_ID=CAMNT_0009388651 /DNA_START=153 /DNA_END=479 /DNA_ORIENTATION=-
MTSFDPKLVNSSKIHETSTPSGKTSSSSPSGSKPAAIKSSAQPGTAKTFACNAGFVRLSRRNLALAGSFTVFDRIFMRVEMAGSFASHGTLRKSSKAGAKSVFPTSLE